MRLCIPPIRTPPGHGLKLALEVGLWAGLLAGLCGCQRTEVRHWPNGAPRSEGRVDRWSRLEQGLWTYSFPNGERREEGRYEDGVRVGRWREWHSNGSLRAEGERRFDPASGSSPREGLWTLWYEEGSLEARGVYRAGQREGHWDYFLHDGRLDEDRTGEYHDDQYCD